MRCPDCSRKLSITENSLLCFNCGWSGKEVPDQLNQDRMWEEYKYLVQSITTKECKQRPWVTEDMQEDLLGTANEAFVYALRKWKPDGGAEFCTYVHRVVRGSLLDALVKLQTTPSLWGYEIPQEVQDDDSAHYMMPPALQTQPVRDADGFLEELTAQLDVHGKELIRVVLEADLKLKHETPEMILRASRQHLLHRRRTAPEGAHTSRWSVDCWVKTRKEVEKAVSAV